MFLLALPLWTRISLMPDICTGCCRQQHWCSFALWGLRKLQWKWVLQAAFTASFHQPRVSLGLTTTCKRSQSATQRYCALMVFFPPYRFLVRFKDSLAAYKLLPEIIAVIIMINMYIVVAGKGHHNLQNHSLNSHKTHNNWPSLPLLQNKIMMSLLQVPSSHAITQHGRCTTFI